MTPRVLYHVARAKREEAAARLHAAKTPAATRAALEQLTRWHDAMMAAARSRAKA